MVGEKAKARRFRCLFSKAYGWSHLSLEFSGTIQWLVPAKLDLLRRITFFALQNFITLYTRYYRYEDFVNGRQFFSVTTYNFVFPQRVKVGPKQLDLNLDLHIKLRKPFILAQALNGSGWFGAMQNVRTNSMVPWSLSSFIPLPVCSICLLMLLILETKS